MRIKKASEFLNESINKEIDITEKELRDNLLGVKNLVKKGDQLQFDFKVGSNNKGHITYDPETGLELTIDEESWKYQKNIIDKKTFFDAFDFNDEKNWNKIK